MFSRNMHMKLYFRTFLPLLNSLRNRSHKVPDHPIYRKITKEVPVVEHIDKEMIEHLERLALVDFANPAGIERLQEAIKFANQLSVIDTTNVEPMVSTLEDRQLFLDEDNVTEGNCRNEILKNARKLEENYFITPFARSSSQERKIDFQRESDSVQNV